MRHPCWRLLVIMSFQVDEDHDSSNNNTASPELVELISSDEEEEPPTGDLPPDLVQNDQVEAPTPTDTAASQESSPSGAARQQPVLATPSDIAGTSTESPKDFRNLKRRRLSSPRKSPVKDASSEDDEEGQCCPICFEKWTNSGSHRLASLRCGHLFGQSCIEKWLKGQGGKCPHCNAKACKKDIRVIFAKALKTVDTSERDRALAELETEKTARRKAEMEAAQSHLRYHMLLDECNRMKQEMEQHRQQMEQLRRVQPTNHGDASQTLPQLTSKEGYSFDRIIRISEQGQCRVMAYTPHSATLCVSQPSSNLVFPGFGVKKLNVLDWRSTQYVSLHSKMIRDMAFNPASADGLLLSCSMDKTVKITNVVSNSVVQTFSVSTPVWSCTWNLDDGNFFYCGFPNGSVNVYDLRNTSEHVQQLNTQSNRSPVVSLQYVPYQQQSSFRPGGLLVGQLEQCSFYEKRHDGEYKPHALSANSSLTSLSLEPHTRHMVASYRPNARHPTVRHMMQELCQHPQEPSADGSNPLLCSLNTVHTLQGGRTQALLSRSHLLPHPTRSNQLLLAAGEEATSSVHIWDTANGKLAQKLPSQGSPVLDLCSVEVNGDHYLVTLMDKQMALFKWR